MEYLQKLNSFFKPHYQINDLKFLRDLIETKMSIKTCLEMISSNKTKKLSNEISLKLDEGYLFEDIIVDYVPNNISKYFEKMIKILGFNKTIDICINIAEAKQRNIESIMSKVLYPIILMIVSVVALIVFDSFALDSIIQMMSSFISDFTMISIFRIVFGIVTKLLILVIVLIGVVLALCIVFNKGYIVYSYLNTILPNSILCTYFTNEFINLYMIIIENGYNTKETLDIISSLDNLVISSRLADSISFNLINGEGLIQSININGIDKTLTSFFKIASYSKESLKILKSYLEFSESKIKSFIKKLTEVLQISSYVVIGMIIIFVYQLLFMPMQAITGF